ncbi:MAG: hypothetical protein B6I19_02715 [Bacteroidetes bacterium 4572_114]|nr:MAG: hypothetical protein B6I19_02715 [Bacteroidetes bacterium 4572_114]
MLSLKKVKSVFRKHTTRLVLNPFVLAIPFTFLIYYLMPVEFAKFKVELIDEKTATAKHFYYDLDFDGDSEEIRFGYDEWYSNKNARPNLQIYDIPFSQIGIDQVNFDYDFVENARPVFSDYDHDSHCEVYAFLKKDTCLYLEGVKFYDTAGNYNTFIQKFVDYVYTDRELEDYNIFNAPSVDLNGDGFNEIIFFVNGLYSAKPRALYALDVKNDTIVKSPEMAVSVGAGIDILQHPTLRKKWIITVNTKSPINYKKHKDIIDDSCGWAMAFDEKLDFWFNPIPNKNGYSYYIQNTPYTEQSDVGIISLFKVPKGSEELEVLKKIDLKGNIIAERIFEKEKHYSFQSHRDKPGELFWLIQNKPPIKFLINTDLETLKTFTSGYPFPSVYTGTNEFLFDLDSDGKQEIIHTNTDNRLIIYTQNLTHPVIVPYQRQSRLKDVQMIKIKKASQPILFLQNGAQKLFYHYSFNKLYYWKYAIILSIYLMSVVFFYFLKQLYRHQMLSIKNQVDLHFTLNAINNISSMYVSGRREEADRFLTKFSRLIHRSLMDSDKIETTIGEELQFVTDYLDVQKIRFKGAFNYEVHLENETLKAVEIPRQLIHTFVENAIKHGLRPKGEGGILKIEIKGSGSKLVQIIIDDNGIGRKETAKNKSTSKGLSIVNQIIELYGKLKNRKVSFEIIDKKDESGEPAGTKVKVIIHSKNQP